MKKLLLAITFLFIYTIGIAQASSSSFTAFSTKMAKYNNNLETWIWSESNDVNMLITVTDTKIYVDDKVHSIYTIVSGSKTKNTSKTKSYKYRAFDEDGKNCIIELVAWNEEGLAPQMYVVYSNTRFVYSLTSK